MKVCKNPKRTRYKKTHLVRLWSGSQGNDRETEAATATSCQGIHLECLSKPDASKPGHLTTSAEPGGTQRTAAAQRAADFLCICRRVASWQLKTATFHYQSDQAFQPTIISHCHQQRKYTQHLRTLQHFWESTISHELPTDGYTSTIFTKGPASTCHLSSNQLTARALVSSKPSPSPVAFNLFQAPAVEDLLHLPTIGPQEHLNLSSMINKKLHVLKKSQSKEHFTAPHQMCNP